MVSPTTWQDRGGLVVLVYRLAWHAPSSCFLGTEVALPCLVSIFSYIVVLSFFFVIFFPELLSLLILFVGIFWRFSFTCPPSLSLGPSLVFSSLGNLLGSRSILFFCVLIFNGPISLFFWLLSFLGTWRQKTLSFELTIALHWLVGEHFFHFSESFWWGCTILEDRMIQRGKSNMKMDMYECKDATKKTTYIYTIYYWNSHLLGSRLGRPWK